VAYGVPVSLIGNTKTGVRRLTAPGGNVRRIIQWTLVPAAILVVACKGETRSPTAMSDDLKRDLKLASATQNIQISPDEVAPQARKELAIRPKRAPQGPKVVRTQHPTVKASAAPVEVAEVPTQIPQEVQVMASGPSASETPTADSPPLARPAPVPASSYPTTGSIPASNGGGGGIGGVLGGIFVGVMRGGADDDHCAPRRAPRTGRPIGGTGIYGGGSIAGIGGVRVPVVPIGRSRGR